MLDFISCGFWEHEEWLLEFDEHQSLLLLCLWEVLVVVVAVVAVADSQDGEGEGSKDEVAEEGRRMMCKDFYYSNKLNLIQSK